MIDVTLGLFAKYWQPGAVKTRLARSIGPVAACRIYQLFLKHLIGSLDGCCQSQILVYTPETRREQFHELAPGWETVVQSEGDLGERMFNFFESAFDQWRDQPEGSPKVIAIGADCPGLDTACLTTACAALDTHDVVVGPSHDGGYYLIGMRNEAFRLFDGIRWSSSSVLAATLEKINQLDLSFEMLAQLRDVDELDDLEDLVRGLVETSGLSSADDRLLQQIVAEFPEAGRFCRSKS